jgi:hypothetical protein
VPRKLFDLGRVVWLLDNEALCEEGKKGSDGCEFKSTSRKLTDGTYSSS